MLNSLLPFAGRRKVRLADNFPALLLQRAIQSTVEHDLTELSRQHELYVREVSTPEMAVSWKISALLFTLARLIRPAAVADTGSGFSSFVLRRYAATAGMPVTVYSTDDHPGWLEKTREYLQAQQADTSHLYAWDDFTRTTQQFDLLFHDVGSMQMRADVLPQVISRVKPGGILILDDMHKRKYRRAALDVFRARGLMVHSLRELCLDDLGRFADVVMMPAAAVNG